MILRKKKKRKDNSNAIVFNEGFTITCIWEKRKDATKRCNKLVVEYQP